MVGKLSDCGFQICFYLKKINSSQITRLDILQVFRKFILSIFLSFTQPLLPQQPLATPPRHATPRPAPAGIAGVNNTKLNIIVLKYKVDGTECKIKKLTSSRVSNNIGRCFFLIHTLTRLLILL